MTMELLGFGASSTTTAVSAPPTAEYKKKSLCLDEFIEALPLAVHSRKKEGFHAGSKDDPIRTLFE
jgi:hypothetical protein